MRESIIYRYHKDGIVAESVSVSLSLVISDKGGSRTVSFSIS